MATTSTTTTVVRPRRTARDLAQRLGASESRPPSFSARRVGGRLVRPTIEPVRAEHRWLIGVGVRDAGADRAVVDWAAAVMRPSDALHIVHAYLPTSAGNLIPPSNVRMWNGLRLAAGRVVGEGVQQAVSSLAACQVDGSAIAGLAEDVLVELSREVDLLVVGSDLGPNPAVAARTLMRSRSVTVEVPATYRVADDTRPVTVLGDDVGFSTHALGFAAEMADRRHVTLQVARAWSAQLDGVATAAWLAERHEEMDAVLVDLTRRHPGLPITTRIELVPGWIALAGAHSSLVVADRRLGGAVRGRSVAAAPCPLAIVPE